MFLDHLFGQDVHVFNLLLDATLNLMPVTLKSFELFENALNLVVEVAQKQFYLPDSTQSFLDCLIVVLTHKVDFLVEFIS